MIAQHCMQPALLRWQFAAPLMPAVKTREQQKGVRKPWISIRR